MTYDDKGTREVWVGREGSGSGSRHPWSSLLGSRAKLIKESLCLGGRDWSHSLLFIGTSQLRERRKMRVNLCRSLRAASVMTSKIADGYQQNSKWQRNGGKRFVENEVVPYLGNDILDLGCGTGELSAYLAELVGPKGRVLAVDPDKERIRVAQESLKCFSGWETSRVIGWRNVCVTNVTALEPANFVLIMIVTQGCCRSLCLKGLCHAICYLFKKLKLHQLTSKNNVQLCSLRLYLSTETVCCRPSQRMERMDMHWGLKKLGQLFQVLMLCLKKKIIKK